MTKKSERPAPSRAITKAVLVASTLVLSACASFGASDSFDEVSDTVAERTGQKIFWRQGTSEDQEADAAVAALLQDDLTLDEAVQVALLNNRQLQATYESLGIAQANLVQAGLLRNPIFDAAATFPLGGGVVDLELALVQDFLDILAIPLRRKVAASQLEETKLRTTATVLDHAGDTRASYYRLQGAYQLLEMRRDVAGATAASSEAMRRLRDAGNVRKLDLDNERLLNERARLNLATAELAVLGTREELNRAMGLWGEDVDWQPVLRLPDLPKDALDLSDIESSAVAASIDLALLRQKIQTIAARAGVQNLEAVLGDLETGGIAERSDREWEAGPSISFAVPIFDQGQARRAVARGELNQKLEEYYARAVEIRSIARDARQRLQTARAAVERYRDVVLPLESGIAAELQLQYNAMQIGVFDLLTAKERQIQTGANYVQALESYWLANAAVGLILNGRLPRIGSVSPAPDDGSAAAANPVH